MQTDEVLELYDRDYAQSYDQRFFFNERWRPKYDLEVELVRGLVRDDDRWLDVACGTGHFLSLFPQVIRAGLDLSPSMLEEARRRNPGIELVQGDFLEPRPEWEGKWSLVTSMWYAYCLVSSVKEVERFVANLASWTSPQGRCFVPLFHPEKACKIDIPYQQPDIFGGRFYITGITWSWIEDGKAHLNLVAPQTDYMVELFERHFDKVDLLTYSKKEIFTPFKAVLASGKRAVAGG